MISLADARAAVLAVCAPLPARAVALADAVGCVTAEAVRSLESVPPFVNSAMDGFAVRAADTAGASEAGPVRLQVVDTLMAGMAPGRTVEAGEAIRIMTGAPLPDGADAVVMVERSRPAGSDEVDLTEEVRPGAAVRDAGDDVQPGDEVVPAGTLLRPAHLGVLASVGCTEVVVRPRPRVGLLSTGDELVPPGEPLSLGQIRDSNRPMLVALVAAIGAEPIDLGRVPDDEAQLETRLRAGAQDCDVIVTSGGVSMGEADVVKLVLGRIASMDWMQIAIRPAKPFALGRIDGTPVLGLPGNPVSSFVSFQLLARPGLRQMAGRTDLDHPCVAAVADAAMPRRPDGKTHFLRVRTTFDGARVHVAPVGAQGSHQLSATAGADGLAVLPDGDGVGPGDDLEVLLMAPEVTLATSS
ncbi:MAG: molybdopterin molybdotransferase MoeA [Acidimicrobiia bacterium]|nr:molybdopterin molybdotransferase MoeA [Acidimicrobiia bacterium]